MTALQAAAFEPLVGSTFTVIGVWDPATGAVATEPELPAVPLDLVAVDVMQIGGPYEQFRLLFHGPSALPLEQGTYCFEPPVGPTDTVFLVPSDERDERRVYAASFSVSRTAAESVGS